MTLRYPTTSKTLIDKLASGDEIGWDEFFERYRPIVRALAKFRGLDDAESDDVCQQVMVRFFHRSRTFRFDPDIARFRTYFGRIVRGVIADFRRRRNPAIPVPQPPDVPVEPEVDRVFMDEWRNMLLKEAERELKNRVTPGTFQAYELFAVQGRPANRVAAFLGCSVNQVYQAKKRCFALLRQIISRLDRQDPEIHLESGEDGR